MLFPDGYWGCWVWLRGWRRQRHFLGGEQQAVQKQQELFRAHVGIKAADCFAVEGRRLVSLVRACGGAPVLQDPAGVFGGARAPGCAGASSWEVP